MTDKAKQQKIEKLKEKIRKLQEDNGEDVFYSYREAAQTDAMLHILEKELVYLEQDGSDNCTTYVLEDDEANTTAFYVVDNKPDPINRIITKDSLIGSKLISSKLGDSIIIGNKTYRIKKVE